MWLEAKYLNKRDRKDRWAWNFGIQQGRPITVRETRKWKPAVAYRRYADDFVVIVKGTRAQAEEIRKECRAFLEGELKLALNMEKTHPSSTVSVTPRILTPGPSPFRFRSHARPWGNRR